MKCAIITGISGQGGAYLARLLLEKGYKVHGISRSVAVAGLWRLVELGIASHGALHLEFVDVADPEAVTRLIRRVQPDEVYNLAAQSSAVRSLDDPISTAHVNALGPLHLLEAIRRFCPQARFFQAGSAEMFGDPEQEPQDEFTPLEPNNPYGVAKLFAHSATVDYRKRCGVFGVSGLLYNHESPLRGKEFVTRKIALAFVEMSLGRLEPLEIGNLDAVRDWGYAEDFVDGYWRSLQVDTPDTYVFATGKASRVRDFIRMAADFVGFDLDWSGDGVGEIGYDRRTGRILVRVNSQFYRPLDLRSRIGLPAKARQKLGWIAKTDLSGLCRIMVDAEKRRNQGKA